MHEEQQEHPVSERLTRQAGMLALLLLTFVAIGYAWHEHSVASRFANENEQVMAAVKNTQSQMEALTAKLNALTAPPLPQPVTERAVTASKRKPRSAASHSVRRDDPRWKQIQDKLASQNDDIQSTRQDLANAKTELSGSIARTHGELVVLQKKGERNYYEFSLDKSKDYWHQGPIGLRLRKANVKHQYADVEMIVDDAKLQQKHVNLYQPVVFYAAEGQRPIELVINSVKKNHIHGYVSEPKYKQSELSAMSAAGDQGPSAATSSEGAATRQRLQVTR